METLVKQGALGSVLLGSRIIAERDIEAALEEQKRTGCRFGEALVSLGKVSQEDIDWAISSQLNIPYVRLKPEMIDKSAVELVPASVARKFSLIPIFRAGDEISIALADPLNRAAICVVEQITGCRVTVSMPIMRELKEMLDIFYGPADSSRKFGFSSHYFPAKILETINGDTTGASFMDYMLLYIIKNKLNGISLQPLADFVSVTGKHGDASREIGRLDDDYYLDLLMHIRKQGRVKGCTDISAKGILEFHYKGEKVLFRVLTLKGPDGDYVTFKIHVPVPFPGNFSELGLSEEKIHAFREIASAGQGIVLFASRTAEECSGIMDLFLDEYDTAGKTVMILGERTGKGKKRFPRISFRKDSQAEMESAVSAVLEHDPDIIVIEDVNDGRPLSIAARAAMRGKLVLCGIPRRDTAEVLEYLMGFRQNGVLLSQIRGALVFRAGVIPCPVCMQVPDAVQQADSVQGSSDLPGLDSARGCPACGYTGFSGRKFLVDVIPFTGETAKVLSSAEAAGDVLKYVEGKGYNGMVREWDELLRSGAIVPAEFVAYGE